MTTGRGRSAERARGAARDQARSSFTAILERLVEATPAADGAVLVDLDGEAVDYAGSLDPFDLKIAAAHWQIVLAGIPLGDAIGSVRQIVIRSRERSFVARRVYAGYTVVLVLRPRAAFAVSERALEEADALLSAEAGWPPPRGTSRWFAAHVEPHPGDRRRPGRLRVGGRWWPVEIIGSLVGLRPSEQGFRVRLPSGVEAVLVREPLGRWYSDEPIAP